MRDIRPGKPIKKVVVPEKLNNLMDQEIELYEASSQLKKDGALTNRSADAVPSEQVQTVNKQAPVSKDEARAERKKANFKGSKIPVTNIHVDKDSLPGKISNSGRADQQSTDKKRFSEGRPLFVKVPGKKKGRRVQVGKNERNSFLIFLVLLFIAGIGATVIFLPTATIIMKLRTAPLLVDEQLIIGSEKNVLAGSMIPGTAFFREVQLDGSSQVTSTEVVGTKAVGVVEIVNRTLEEQKIKDRSRLVTDDGLLFYMQKHAIVPPNSRVSIDIEAAEAGVEGNIEAQKLNFAGLDEDSRRLVFAEVETRIVGGSGDIISVVKDEDIEQAKISAGEEARRQAESEIKAELLDGWEILEESWTAKLESFETPINVDDKEPVINYQARVVVQVMGYEKNKLEEKLKESLEEGLNDDYMLFPGSISYVKSVNDTNWETAQATVSVRVTHTTIPRLYIDSLRSKLAGRSVAEAQSYLEGLPGVKSASMSLWPFWVNSIPRIEKRVSLSFEPENQP